LTQKVSGRGFIFAYFLRVAFPLCSLISSKMDICIVSFIAPIDQEIGLFIHSAMAGGKSKDGGSVPKKGSR
jgi:hypothetical protein